MVHPAAARGFARSAGEYERSRPGYPPDALAWLAERPDLRRGRVVLDLAAGTGRLTRHLAATGADVVAVEPVAEMRVVIGPGAVAGTAEAIPVGDGSADAVTVGEAFHWFDGPRALAEIHRVLRPGGRLALAWNLRAEDDPAHRAISALVDPYRGATPARATGAWRTAFGESDLFGPLEERAFEHAERYDGARLGELVGSISFVASLDAAERESVMERARAMAGGSELEVAFRCEVQVTRRMRARPPASIERLAPP